MEVIINKTNKQDYHQTENLTREAFWDVYKPGCDEHLILHNIRNSQCFIGELDLVATVNNNIVGHIICTIAKVVDVKEKMHIVLCVGPISVMPEYQGKGIGSKLMRRSISIAKELGFPGMILFGNPNYYHRFGFKNALEYNISTKDGQNFEPFMALEIQDKGFEGIQGKFYEDDVFIVEPEELEAFEKNFPYKEKHVTPTQLK